MIQRIIEFFMSLFVKSKKEDVVVKIPYREYDYSDLELYTLFSVNAHRSFLGLNELVVMDYLSFVSEEAVELMIKNGKISHNGNVSRFEGVVEQTGATKVGENLAYNYKTAEGIVGAWLRSPSHKKLLEDKDLSHFGISIRKNSEGKNYIMNLFILGCKS